MLSLFPSLLDFGPLAPTFLRFVVGFIFIDIGYFSIIRTKSTWGLLLTLLGKNPESVWRKILGGIELIGGVILLMGLYTQGAALVLVLITLFKLLVEYKEPSFVRRDFIFYLLLFVVTLSLLITGPGAFSFDLPL